MAASRLVWVRLYPVSGIGGDSASSHVRALGRRPDRPGRQFENAGSPKERSSNPVTQKASHALELGARRGRGQASAACAGGSSRLDWIEVYGNPVPRSAAQSAAEREELIERILNG